MYNIRAFLSVDCFSLWVFCVVVVDGVDVSTTNEKKNIKCVWILILIIIISRRLIVPAFLINTYCSDQWVWSATMWRYWLNTRKQSVDLMGFYCLPVATVWNYNTSSIGREKQILIVMFIIIIHCHFTSVTNKTYKISSVGTNLLLVTMLRNKTTFLGN